VVRTRPAGGIQGSCSAGIARHVTERNETLPSPFLYAGDNRGGELLPLVIAQLRWAAATVDASTWGRTEGTATYFRLV
jgi:hypothetical protein